MIVLKVLGLAQAHDPQGSSDGAFTWRENGTQYQDFDVLKNPLGEQRRKYQPQFGKLQRQSKHG